MLGAYLEHWEQAALKLMRSDLKGQYMEVEALSNMEVALP